MRGERTGLLVGFFCGLLIDIFYGDAIGLHAMMYMYIGYLNGKFNGIFYPEDIKLPMGLIVISDLLYGLTTYFLQFLMRSRFAFQFYFMNIILPEIVYTILTTLLLYPIILWINTRLDDKEKAASSSGSRKNRA
jgi:rod shape-determining protein MreD